MDWIIPANCKVYDLEASFEKNGFVDWTKRANIVMGDKVYIYQTKPVGKIKYKTLVERDNLREDEIIDDSEFLIDKKFKVNESARISVRLKLVKEIKSDKLTLESLKAIGLKSSFQGIMKLRDPLLLQLIEDSFCDDHTIE
ncbi:MAG TPA: hypothetical protein DCQ90_03500 [Erysipelotrichaceae bacterium]|nr:hypothetical protein [Erysipelotrichaceae bacterium]